MADRIFYISFFSVNQDGTAAETNTIDRPNAAPDFKGQFGFTPLNNKYWIGRGTTAATDWVEIPNLPQVMKLITDAVMGISGDGEENVQSDWDETDPASDAYIDNKPPDGDPTWTTPEDRAQRAVWSLANILKAAGRGGADLSAIFANLIAHVVHDGDLILADARENRLAPESGAEENNLIDADKDPLRKSSDPQIYSEDFDGNTYYIIPTLHVREVSVYEIGDHTFTIPIDKDIMGLYLHDRDYGTAQGALIIGNGRVVLMVRSNLDRGTLQFEDFAGDTEQERFRASFGVVDQANSGGFFFVTSFFDGITQDGFAATDAEGKFTKAIRFVTHLNDQNIPKLQIDLVRFQALKSDDYGAYSTEQIAEHTVNRQMDGINASPRSIATETRTNALKIATLSDGLARLLGMNFLNLTGLLSTINGLKIPDSADQNTFLLGVDVKQIADDKGLIFSGTSTPLSDNGTGTPAGIPFKGSVVFGRPDFFYFTGLLTAPTSGENSVSVHTTDGTPITVALDAPTAEDMVLRAVRDSVDYSNSALIIFDGVIFLMFTDREALPTTPPAITLNTSWDDGDAGTTDTSMESATFSDFEQTIPNRELRLNGSKGVGYRWNIPAPIRRWQNVWKNRNQVFEGFRVAVEQFREFPDGNFDPTKATPRDPFLASRQLWFDPRTGRQTLSPTRRVGNILEMSRAVRDTDSQQVVGYTFGSAADMATIGNTANKLEIVPKDTVFIPEGATRPTTDTMGATGFLITFAYPDPPQMFFDLGASMVGRNDVALSVEGLKVSTSTVLDARKVSAQNLGADLEKEGFQIPATTEDLEINGTGVLRPILTLKSGLTVGRQYVIAINLIIKEMRRANEGIVILFTAGIPPVTPAFASNSINASTDMDPHKIYRSFVATATTVSIYVVGKNTNSVGQVEIEAGGFLVEMPGQVKWLTGNSFS